MAGSMFAPYVEAGFAGWVVDPRRHLQPRHSIAEMADDHARVIGEEFGGRVDVVDGEDFGGMIAQHLAAFHPDSLRHLALGVTAAELSDWGKKALSRLGDALARGDRAGAGTVFAQDLLSFDRRFFPKHVVQETAELIPHCTLVWYEGKGLLGAAASNKRVGRDALAFVSRT